MHTSRITRYALLAAVIAALPSMACTQEAQDAEPTAYLTGQLTVNAQIDSTGDYSGMEIIVTDGNEDGPDTLAYAITDVDGRFATDVKADERGVFPLIIKRGPAVLSVSQFVVAPYDSTTLSAELPLGQRIPIVKSYENSGWLAFRNAENSHSERVAEMLAEGNVSPEQVRSMVELESGILWSLRTTYPGTMAADVASAKAVVMLDGWNDSLLVERLRQIDPSAPGFAESVAAGGRAESRLNGIDAGLSLLTEMKAKADRPHVEAAIQREIVQAYLDTGNGADAVAAAEILITSHPETEWARWAAKAQYEAENLLPGMPAPPFTVATLDGATITLDSLSGRLVVIDFWSPRDPKAAQQLPEIKRVVDSDGWSQGLVWVSVPLEPDSDLLGAFFEGREVPGIHVRDSPEKMQDLIDRYNVEVVPTRFLVGKDGLIIEKYSGDTLLQLSARIENMGFDTP